MRVLHEHRWRMVAEQSTRDRLESVMQLIVADKQQTSGDVVSWVALTENDETPTWGGHLKRQRLAETAKDNAVAQVVMARAETQRLREELRSIRASVVRALGSEEPRRERPERRKDCGVRADNAKDNATFPAPPNDESTSSVRPSDP